ncbi:MAG TPA: archease [Gammaproteobacteria bacterium]|nr:archease [Gammaproteobacteria bacterium]
MPHWRQYAHEADVGIEGMGDSLAEAFAQAAIALTAVITDPDRVRPVQEVEITCAAPDDELLFVDWLNALIYAMAERKMLFSHFEVNIENHRLHAWVRGEPLQPERHRPAVEIKGATYTTLRVYQDEQHTWHVQTVVDV